MKKNDQLAQKNTTLVDAIDRVVEKGANIQGDIMIRLADVDLLFVGLRLVIASVEKIDGGGRKRKKVSESDHVYIAKLNQKIEEMEKNIPRIIEADKPQKAEEGIAKLVLTLVALIKDLLERETMRRIEHKTLSRQEVEKLGLTFKALDKKIEELKKVFGIKEDLNIDLGPIGKLR